MARTAGQREVHSYDTTVLQPPEMDMSDIDENLDNRKVHIEAVDPEVLKERARMDYEQQLGFNEEFLTIYLYRGQTDFSPDAHTFWVNGRGVTVPVETPVKVRRKYVEIMARSQPFKVKTNVIKPESGDERSAIKNLWNIHKSAAYPFTVIEDKNPRGQIWLEMVKREG